MNLQVNRWRSILQIYSLAVVFSAVFYCCSSLRFPWHFISYISSAVLVIWWMEQSPEKQTAPASLEANWTRLPTSFLSKIKTVRKLEFAQLLSTIHFFDQSNKVSDIQSKSTVPPFFKFIKVSTIVRSSEDIT